jgi:flagellar hook-associated protein 3 FlgL
MRISGNMISNQIIQNLNIDLSRLQDIQQQTTTGQRIKVPSDDPLGAQRVVNVNEALASMEQHQRNNNFVASWVSASESTLNGASDYLLRANSLAIRGANDPTLTQTERNALGDEVNSILEGMVSAGNGTSESKYIFGGYQTQTQPFQVTRVAGDITAVTYAGDDGVDQVEVDQGLTVNKNVTGRQIFQPPAGTDVFATLITLRDNLRSGNIAGIRTGIDDTKLAQQQVVTQISQLGNKANMLEMSASSLTEKKTALTKLSSQLADVDMPDAIVRLQTAQNVYTAALESSAKILQQSSLMNFLSTA